MKLVNLLFSVMILGVFALTSCQSESEGSKTEESAEADISAPANMTANTAAKKVNAQENVTAVPAGPTTSIEFDETSFDFGEINDGDKVRHTFKFTNTGSEPLIISNCKGSCGCTVPECPKDPIAPGDGGEITVEYNSRGKSKGQPEGKVDQKFVNVTANTEPAATRLTIKATVKGDPNAKPANKESK